MFSIDNIWKDMIRKSRKQICFDWVKGGLAALRDGLCLPFDILIAIKGSNNK